MIADTAKSVRIRQALLLLAGALALELLIAQGSLRFYWTPLIIGITYLAAAAAGLILAISPRAPELLYEARTFALVIAAVGLVNLALSVKPTPSRAT